VKLLVTVLVLIALVFGGGALAFRFVKGQADKALHQAVDVHLPDRVAEQPWSPVLHGHAQRRDNIRFDAGTVVTVRCKVALGTYYISILHRFSFQPSVTPIPPGCPGAVVRKALTFATHATESQDTPPILTFDTKSGHQVLTLRGARG
jgi:hypothetical protein